MDEGRVEACRPEDTAPVLQLHIQATAVPTELHRPSQVFPMVPTAVPHLPTETLVPLPVGSSLPHLVSNKKNINFIPINLTYFQSGVGSIVPSPFAAINPFALPTCSAQAYSTSPLIAASK